MRGSIIIVCGALFLACGPDRRDDPRTVELLRAAEAGDAARLRDLLAQGASPRTTDSSRNTPLIAASCRGQHETVRLVLERLEQEGVEAKQTALRWINNGDWTALRCAARLEPTGMNTNRQIASARQLATVRLLLAAGAEVDAAKAGARTPLMEAARTRQVTIVQELLGAGASVGAKDFEGRTALWWAVSSIFMRSFNEGPIQETSVKVISALLERGAEVDARDRAGRTPLFEASARGQADEVRLLLASGADPNARSNRGNGYGFSALHEAASRGQADVVAILLRAGADANAGKDQGRGALVAAAESGSVETIATLLEGRAGPGAEALRDPLMIAARRGDLPLVRFLFERGARPQPEDLAGLETTGDPRILDLLRPR